MAQSKLTKEQREALADCYKIILKAAKRQQQEEAVKVAKTKGVTG